MKNNERDVLWVFHGGDVVKECYNGINTEIVDTRWNPFPRPPYSKELVTMRNLELRVDKWHAPKSFFERMERMWTDTHWFSARFPAFRSNTSKEFALNVNTWLAVLDKFGLEIEYDPLFLAYPKQIIVDILVYAYRVDDSGKYDTLREFNGKTWGQNEFHQYFSRFILNHQLLSHQEPSTCY